MKRFRASLSAFFAWAVRERLIASNPVTATRVSKGRGVGAVIRPFAEDELESFHMAASARGQRLADVLLIASWTGLRWSELRDARVRDFVRVPMPVLLVSRAAPDAPRRRPTDAELLLCGSSATDPTAASLHRLAAPRLEAKSRLVIEVRRPGPELDCNEGARWRVRSTSVEAQPLRTPLTLRGQDGVTVEGAYHDCVTSDRGACRGSPE